MPQDEKKYEVVFPNAEEVQKISAKNYRILNELEILEEITRAAKRGARNAYMFRAYITGSSYQKLEQKGFKVEISSDNNEPFVKISW